MRCGEPSATEDDHDDIIAEERTGVWTTVPRGEGSSPAIETTKPVYEDTIKDPSAENPIVVERSFVNGAEVVFVKRAPGTDPLWPSMGAGGELVLDQEGCMRLETPGDMSNFLLEWPAGFSLEVEGGNVRIIDTEGREAASASSEQVVRKVLLWSP